MLISSLFKKSVNEHLGDSVCDVAGLDSVGIHAVSRKDTGLHVVVGLLRTAILSVWRQYCDM